MNDHPYAEAERPCPRHPDANADHICDRCGTFVCDECRRTVLGVRRVYCEECFGRRGAYLEERKLGGAVNRPADSALVFGLLSLWPMCWPAWIGAVILAAFGLLRARKLGGKGRVKCIVALVLVVLGGLVSLFLGL